MKDSALEHTLNVMRRQVEDEFPDLKIIIITYYEDEEWENTLKDGTTLKKLNNHPAGEHMIRHLTAQTPSGIDFFGITHEKKKGFSLLKKKNNFLAAVAINLDKLQEERMLLFPGAPEKYDRIIGYAMAWQAIKLYQNYKKNETKDLFTKNNIITFESKETTNLRVNLLSECFACMLMEQLGQRGTIQQLMKKRCELTITKTINTKPENHPFPIAYDSTRVVYDDLHNTDPEKMNTIIHHTLSMADEIEMTIDDITLMQWKEFCLGAQEMTWTNRNKHDILSAATYSSEDAHIRTIGYIIAEALNTDVTPLNKHQFHNPFADQEKYERLHQKSATALFEQLIETATQESRPELLLQQALQQNKTLFEGEIIGWCAPALIKTCHAYSKEDIRIELLHDIFHQTFTQTKWKNICRLNRFIMTKKRQNIELNTDIVLKEFIGSNEDLSVFQEAFTAL